MWGRGTGGFEPRLGPGSPLQVAVAMAPSVLVQPFTVLAQCLECTPPPAEVLAIFLSKALTVLFSDNKLEASQPLRDVGREMLADSEA